MPIIGTPGAVTGSAKWNYLYLVRRLAQETKASTDPYTSIPTLAGCTGETRKPAQSFSRSRPFGGEGIGSSVGVEDVLASPRARFILSIESLQRLKT